MDLQLGLTAAERGQDPDRHELAAARVEPRAVVDVTEGERGDVVAERRVDVGERVDHRLALRAVDPREDGQALVAAGEIPGAGDVVLTGSGWVIRHG